MKKSFWVYICDDWVDGYVLVYYDDNSIDATTDKVVVENCIKKRIVS